MILSGRLGRLIRDLAKVTRRHDASIAWVVRRVLRLYIREGIRPREALESGLIDPAVADAALTGCLGKHRLLALQGRLNPAGHECLTEDKSVFYAYCQAAGLPAPSVYAVVERDAAWTPRGELVSARELERWLRDRLPAEFVVKPAAGVYGEGFRAFARSGDGFLDDTGTQLSAGELADLMRQDGVHRRYLIQERLRSHPELQRLSGTSALQTVRVMTLVYRDGRVRLFAPHLKVIAGELAIDNIRGGETGNFPATVDLTDGRLGPGRVFSADRLGMATVRTHPRTGIALGEVRLPHWEEARRLVERAATVFSPLRTIGWDVGLTATGPILVEGNVWWDPPNDLASAPPTHPESDMRQLLQALEAEARGLESA